MKLLVVTAALVVAAFTVTVGVVSAAPKLDRVLTCFTGQSEDPGGAYGGKCAIVDGTAAIDTTLAGNPTYGANYAGVYVPVTPSLSGKKIGDVGQLAFSYTGGPLGGGSPRYSIPIDTNADGGWDVFAFVDTTCDNEAAGTVDVVGDATCPVYVGSEAFTNWTA